jgi:hypothetical protein
MYSASFSQQVQYKNLYGWWILLDDQGKMIADFSIEDSINLFKINTKEKGMPAFYKLRTNYNKTQYLVFGYPRQTDTLYMSFDILKKNNEELILSGYRSVYYYKPSQTWEGLKTSKKVIFKLKRDHRSHQG